MRQQCDQALLWDPSWAPLNPSPVLQEHSPTHPQGVKRSPGCCLSSLPPPLRWLSLQLPPSPFQGLVFRFFERCVPPGCVCWEQWVKRAHSAWRWLGLCLPPAPPPLQAALRNFPGLVHLAPGGQSVAQGLASTQDPLSPSRGSADSWTLQSKKTESWGSPTHKTLESQYPQSQTPKIPAAQCGERECRNGEAHPHPLPVLFGFCPELSEPGSLGSPRYCLFFFLELSILRIYLFFCSIAVPIDHIHKSTGDIWVAIS